jgi:hypothetical protein
LDEAWARVKILTESLPSIGDPRSISVCAKIPFKVIHFRESLFWRTEEFARCACDLYEKGNIGPAIVLTRAIAENAAAVWYLMEIIETNCADIDVDDLDEQVMKLLMGHRTNDEMPAAINVLTMLRKADRQISGILSAYESLSEFAHPNWSGTAGLYSKADHEKILVHFGKNARLSEAPLNIGLNSLVGALMTFEFAYNKISDLMPDFISKCEVVREEPGRV